MTETEQQAAELDRVIAAQRIKQAELRRIVAAGGAVWDYILGRWVEAPR